jgi:hypothetical protein
MDSPVVVLLAAGPPACELPPALPDDCAIATLDDKARIAAKQIVLILIVSSSQFCCSQSANERGDHPFLASTVIGTKGRTSNLNSLFCMELVTRRFSGKVRKDFER